MSDILTKIVDFFSNLFTKIMKIFDKISEKIFEQTGKKINIGLIVGGIILVFIC